MPLLGSAARPRQAHSHALLSLLQEAALVYDEYAHRLVAEMLHHVLPQIVADLLRVPLGRVQQVLHPLRIPLADGLGHLPTVLAFDPA
jgi:hypothetical protein